MRLSWSRLSATAVLFSIILCLSWPGRHASAESAPDTVRLYALDCGSMNFTDMGIFSDTGDYDGKAGSIVDPCFVIRHPKGILLWDVGLGDAYYGRSDPPNQDGVSLRVRAKLIDQLASLGITSANVTFVA